MSVCAILLTVSVSCSPLTPSYDVPNRPVEKPSCGEFVRECHESIEIGVCSVACDDAIACMYSREEASEKYIDVLIKALNKVK